MTTKTAWRKFELGYLSPDGNWFAERGAPMTGGGTAWLVWRRATADDKLVHTPLGSTYSDVNGHYARTLEELSGEANWGFSFTPEEAANQNWFLHVGDAGSLAEAKVWAS